MVVDMNRLSVDQRVHVIAALMEGASINSTVRMTGVSKPTILKLIADLGTACADYHDRHVRNVQARRIQVDPYGASRISLGSWIETLPLPA